MLNIINQDLLLSHLREEFGLRNVGAVISFEEGSQPDSVWVQFRDHTGTNHKILLGESFDELVAAMFDLPPALTRNVEQFPGVSAAGRYAADHPNGDDAA